MPGHDIIVVGASAGGVEALMELVKTLPPDLPASIFIVLHTPAHSHSVLPSILTRAGALPATHAIDGEPVEHRHIYVAPPDRHLLVYNDRVHLSHGPSENGHRPAIDPLFRTAARAYGFRAVGVVLSGLLDDGTAGLSSVKSRGGVALVQDPEEALYSGMPLSAIENLPVDKVLKVREISLELARLAVQEVQEEGGGPVSDEMVYETEVTEMEPESLEGDERPGVPSGYACPACHGVLWEVHEGEIVRFRCRVGHAYAAESLLAEQSESLDAAMWTAFRALKESASLARRMSERARSREHNLAADRFAGQARDAEERASIIRRVLVRGEVNVPVESEEGNTAASPKGQRQRIQNS
jgi:two-component system chemotaxis response regulator CheB